MMDFHHFSVFIVGRHLLIVTPDKTTGWKGEQDGDRATAVGREPPVLDQDLLLRDYDLQLAYHHHLMMLVEHDDELERFLSHTHDNVGLAFDTGHAFVAGVEIPRVLHKYGHRIRHLHLKDVRPQVLGRLYRENLSFNEAVRAGLFTIPGDGCIDYAPILDFVRDSDYRGWLIIEAEQDPAMAPPLATASRAYAWLAHHLSSPSSSEEYAS